MKPSSAFDRRYYDRFYGRQRPRLADRQNADRLGDFVCAYLRYIGQPVRSVLDVGCGVGLWRDVIARQFSKARYRGIEYSEYLCETYGWERGSVVDFETKARFDLVVCEDVLQYLPAAATQKAIANLARLCRGALYLSVLTQEDWDENCNRAKTDADVHKRSASWYRRRLAKHFQNLGGGLFLRNDSPLVVWELEQLR